MSKEGVAILKERRNNRYEAIRDKIDYYHDEAKSYKNTEAVKLMTDTIKIFKDSSGKISKNGESTNYLRFLNVQENDKENFTDTIIENIREVNELFIEKDLKNLEKDLSQTYLENNIEYYDKNQQERYRKAIKLVSHLSMTKRLRKLESELSEIKKIF